MPLLGESRHSSMIRPIVIAALTVSLLAGAAYTWFGNRASPPPDQTPIAAPALAVPSEDSMPAGSTGADVAENNNVGAAPTTAATGTAPAGSPTAAKPLADALPDGWKSMAITINGPLESAIVAATGKSLGTPLTQVVARSLVWWVAVPQDLARGDTLDVIYEERSGQEPLVHGVRFNSKKFGKTFEAYRFKTAENAPGTFIQADGSELEERLVDGPLHNYDQITSLLRDGRRHKGVDFKCAVGTEVHAPFDGTISRTNWSFKRNGNCVELQEAGGQGRTALFLHLSEVLAKLPPGTKVHKGDLIGKSGNSGRSFAPHLHYQLMHGEQVVDPFKSHQTMREQLSAEDKVKFESQLKRMRAFFPADRLG